MKAAFFLSSSCCWFRALNPVPRLVPGGSWSQLCKKEHEYKPYPKEERTEEGCQNLGINSVLCRVGNDFPQERCNTTSEYR